MTRKIHLRKYIKVCSRQRGQASRLMKNRLGVMQNWRLCALRVPYRWGKTSTFASSIHFLRFRKKDAETRFTLGLGIDSLFWSRCTQLPSTLSYCALNFEFFLPLVEGMGMGRAVGGSWQSSAKQVNFPEKQNVTWSSFLFSLRYTNSFNSHSPFIDSEVILSKKICIFSHSFLKIWEQP